MSKKYERGMKMIDTLEEIIAVLLGGGSIIGITIAIALSWL